MLMMDVTSVRTQEAGIQCGIGVRLQAQGSAGASARWGEAVVEVFDGRGGDASLPTVTFPATEIRDLIGESIAAGDERTYTLYATHELPFHGTLRQSYHVVATGASGTAEASFECGPTASAGASPELSAVEVLGAPEPGRTLGVRFRATSDVGLWSARLRVSGASTSDTYVAVTDGVRDREFEIFHEIPIGAALGGSVQQRISVTDLAGRTAFVDVPAVTLVDATPPELLIRPHCKLSLDFCPTPTGRTFNIEVTTEDASPHTVEYWVGSPPLLSDSAARPGGWTQELVMIPTSDLILGRHPFAVTARDSMGRESADTLGGELLVYPSRETAVVSTELVGATTDVRIDAERDLLYLARPGEDGVTAVSLQTLDPVGSIPVTGEPWSLDLTTSGDSLLVALGDRASVDVVDPDGARPTESVTLDILEPGFRARAVRVGMDGRWLVHSDRPRVDGVGVEVALVLFDPRTGEQDVLAQEPGNHRRRLVASGDRARIVAGLGCPRIWDVATESLSPCAEYLELAELATDHTGSVFGDGWWSLDGDLIRLHHDHPIGDGVEAVDFTPDGRMQLLVSPTGVHVLDVERWLPTLFLQTGTLPTGRLEVSVDGTFAIAWGTMEVYPTAETTPLARISLEEALAVSGR